MCWAKPLNMVGQVFQAAYRNMERQRVRRHIVHWVDLVLQVTADTRMWRYYHGSYL